MIILVKLKIPDVYASRTVGKRYQRLSDGNKTFFLFDFKMRGYFSTGYSISSIKNYIILPSGTKINKYKFKVGSHFLKFILLHRHNFKMAVLFVITKRA